MDLVIRNARVLVVVKAYPNPSKSHIETVCTAGLLDGKQWIRIYPVSYRFLQEESQYPKYGWITLDLKRRTQDFRPESYSPNRGEQEPITLLSSISVKGYGWAERKRYVLQNVYSSMDALIERAKSPEYVSIGVVKPKRIEGVLCEEVEREWAIDLDARDPEFSFTDGEEVVIPKALVKKVPYKFSYQFQTDDGKDRSIMVEDWELGALYWNCLKNANGDERIAREKVKQKLLYLAEKTDIHFIMGTMLAHHHRALNPFVIIGLFYPPIDLQPELF